LPQDIGSAKCFLRQACLRKKGSGFGTLGNDQFEAANQIALSLALPPLRLPYLSVAVTIRVGNRRTYGLCEIAACGAIHIFITTSWRLFCSYFVVFHQYLPQLFVNVNDMRKV
jgi:MATE family multidrug resistance protein